MKSIFFQKGQKGYFAANQLEIIETSNNLDSKKYNLIKIPIGQFQKQSNCIQKHFYFHRQDNLISYFNCWKEIQNIAIDKPSFKEKQKRKTKAPMMELIKKKAKTIQSEHLIAPSKKKINEQATSQNYIIQESVFVQMEYFSQIQIPNDFNSIRELMAIIYLLGKKVQKQTGCVPCLIPVQNEQNDRIKFYKKGLSIESQLYKLMMYLLREKQQNYLRQWSQPLQKAIHKAQINRDYQLIRGLLKKAIQEYIDKPQSICMINQTQKIRSIQTVTIVDFQTIKLMQSQIQLPLQQYKIEYMLKSQNDRQITLTHEIFQQYILLGHKSNFIVKWLYNMAT